MGSTVSTRIIDIQQLLASDAVTLIPGEVYPENNIRLVEIISNDFCSREACCGTHVLNLRHLEEFCLTKVQNVSRVATVLRAVTGKDASEILHRSRVLEDKINKFLQHKPSDTKHILSQLNEIRAELTSAVNPISYIMKTEYLMKIESLIKISKHAEHQNLHDFIDVEMRDVMDSVVKSEQEFLVHNLICSSLMTNVKLDKVTRYCKDKPVMIFSYSNGNVKARCCVPKELTTEQFDAQKWLETAAKLFRSEAAAPKGQHHSYVCIMKLKRISEPEYHDLLEKAIKTATEYANINFPKVKK